MTALLSLAAAAVGVALVCRQRHAIARHARALLGTPPPADSRISMVNDIAGSLLLTLANVWLASKLDHVASIVPHIMAVALPIGNLILMWPCAGAWPHALSGTLYVQQALLRVVGTMAYCRGGWLLFCATLSAAGVCVSLYAAYLQYCMGVDVHARRMASLELYK